MFIIQMTLIFSLLTFEKYNWGYKNNTALNLCLFFTVLILHWMCIPNARDSIYMMKYALCCPNEFTNPHAAFALGFMQFNGICLTEVCNLLKSLDQTSPQTVIAKFVGFSLILLIPKILVGSMESFEV
jgi:hypothetical protein